MGRVGMGEAEKKEWNQNNSGNAERWKIFSKPISQDIDICKTTRTFQRRSKNIQMFVRDKKKRNLSVFVVGARLGWLPFVGRIFLMLNKQYFWRLKWRRLKRKAQQRHKAIKSYIILYKVKEKNNMHSAWLDASEYCVIKCI